MHKKKEKERKKEKNQSYLLATEHDLSKQETSSEEHHKQIDLVYLSFLFGLVWSTISQKEIF